MIQKHDTGAIIHFYQKMIDKTVLVRFTTDFIMRVFALFYRKKHTNQDQDSDRMIQSIQANLFAKVNEYAKTIACDENNIIEIMFEKDDLIPIVQHHRQDKKSDILLDVFFKKVGWDEINVFRSFFVRYLEYYFAKILSKTPTDRKIVNKIVNDLSYIVQELLQNANAYSIGEYDYELSVSHKDDKVFVTVENYTDKDNLNQLVRIIEDIKTSGNLQELILKYMLSQEKHLGLISSVFNNNVESIDYAIESEGLVKVSIVVKIF